MKKYISAILAALLLFNLSACGKSPAGEKPIQIVTTVFPEYDWVREVLGEEADHAEVTLLLDSGVDLHNYQPSAQDILKISTCDLFVYVGGESDRWVEDALQEVVNEDRKVMNLLEVLGDGAREEELVDGMEGEDDVEEEEPEYDEHVWLSLKNAQVFTGVIADTLAEIDPANAEVYQANCASYHEKLSALDAEYQTAVDAGSVDTLLFGDRFPFRYLADDYGLDYYAAFAGCSAETEASFETITFLAGKADELGLHTILTLESSDQKIAQTIVRNTSKKDQQILTMDSIQSTTSEDAAEGVTYLSAMENNLRVLTDALK